MARRHGSRERARWRGGRSRWLPEPAFAGVEELNEMTIGRTDDPGNPSHAPAVQAALVFASGSRNPSGPAASVPRQQAGHMVAIEPPRPTSRALLLHPGGRPHMHGVLAQVRPGSGTASLLVHAHRVFPRRVVPDLRGIGSIRAGPRAGHREPSLPQQAAGPLHAKCRFALAIGPGPPGHTSRCGTAAGRHRPPHDLAASLRRGRRVYDDHG